jgi:hypothetical protein
VEHQNDAWNNSENSGSIPVMSDAKRKYGHKHKLEATINPRPTGDIHFFPFAARAIVDIAVFILTQIKFRCHPKNGSNFGLFLVFTA